MSKKDMLEEIYILERNEHFEIYVELETGEIKTRLLVDPKEKEVRDKKEIERRRKYYEEQKDELIKYIEKKLKKKAKKEELKDDERGEFFMATMGKKKIRKKSEVKPRLIGLTMTEEGYLFYFLANFFKSSKKPLMIILDNKEEKFLNKHAEELLKISKGRISQLFTKFVEVDALFKKPNEKGYYVNEKYFKMKTLASGEYVTRIYQPKLKEIIVKINKLVDELDDQMACLGLIFRMAYMVHQQTYHLCANPDVPICEEGESIKEAIKRNPGAIEYYGTREFLKALNPSGKNLDFDKLEFMLSVLFAAGVITSTSGAGRVYQIHPDLMHRQFTKGIDDYSDDVRLDFDITMAAGKKQLASAKRDRTKLLRKKANKLKENEQKKKG